MKKLSNSILEITNEILLKEMDDPLFEGLLDRLGISPSNIVSGAKQLAGNFKVDPAGIANAAIALVGNDQSFADAVTKRASDAISNLKSANAMKAVKRMIDFQYAGSFKSKDDLATALDAYFKAVNTKSPQIKSGSGEIFDKFLALSFYFSASKNFSNIPSLSKDQIEVKDYLSEESKIFSSGVLPAGVQFSPLKTSNIKYDSGSDIDRQASELTNNPRNSDKVRITSLTSSGDSASASIEVSDAIKNRKIDAKLRFVFIKETTTRTFDRTEGTPKGNSQFKFKEESVDIEELSSGNISINGQIIKDIKDMGDMLSKGLEYKIFAYVEWLEGNDYLESNYVELPQENSNILVPYKDICTDVITIIEKSSLNGDLSGVSNELIIPENSTSLPYFLASLGLCSALVNDKSRSYLLDFTPIVSAYAKLKEGMTTGVFKKSSEFDKNV